MPIHKITLTRRGRQRLRPCWLASLQGVMQHTIAILQAGRWILPWSLLRKS